MTSLRPLRRNRSFAAQTKIIEGTKNILQSHAAQLGHLGADPGRSSRFPGAPFGISLSVSQSRQPPKTRVAAGANCFFLSGLLHGTKSPHPSPADVAPDLVAILNLNLTSQMQAIDDISPQCLCNNAYVPTTPLRRRQIPLYGRDNVSSHSRACIDLNLDAFLIVRSIKHPQVYLVHVPG